MKQVAIFSVFVVVVLALLFSISGTRAPRIPDDDRHVEWNREEICLDCHGPEGEAPRTETHPPKDMCLECHHVKDRRRLEKTGG